MRIKSITILYGILGLLAISSSLSHGQPLAIDGKFGISFLTGNGSSTGFLIGGGMDIPFQQSLYFRPELNITSHGGTPIEIGAKLKYLMPQSNMNMNLYLVGGLGVWFYSGGSALGIDGGVGTLFPLSGSNLKIPAEIRLGPIFESSTSIFQIALTTGIRFDLQ